MEQAYLVGRYRKHLGIFEHLELGKDVKGGFCLRPRRTYLVSGAGGAKDLQFVAGLVDGLEADLLQDTVQDLWKAKSALACKVGSVRGGLAGAAHLLQGSS